MWWFFHVSIAVNNETEEDDDDAYDAAYILGLVKNAFPLTNVNKSPQNDRSDGPDVITTVQNPYYCDGDLDLADNTEGNTQRWCTCNFKYTIFA